MYFVSTEEYFCKDTKKNWFLQDIFRNEAKKKHSGTECLSMKFYLTDHFIPIEDMVLPCWAMLSSSSLPKRNVRPMKYHRFVNSDEVDI